MKRLLCFLLALLLPLASAWAEETALTDEEVTQLLWEMYQTENGDAEVVVLPDEYDADDEQQMRANNTSSFCYRVVAGSKTLSKHARGLAVDINTLYNPYVKKRADGSLYVQPSTARPYADRTKNFPCKIDKTDLCYRLFIEQGFKWGGSWRTVKDYQHFEY